jgi:hypothetical protein
MFSTPNGFVLSVSDSSSPTSPQFYTSINHRYAGHSEMGNGISHSMIVVVDGAACIVARGQVCSPLAVMAKTKPSENSTTTICCTKHFRVKAIWPISKN